MLTIKDLSYRFSGTEGSNPIFEHLSLQVEKGEFVSLIGASGSGKSTLFRLIAGLLEPNQGEIRIAGDLAPNRLGKVGYMPQKDLLLPWRTVIDNILLPLELARESKAKKKS